jgi:CubicO group peptidase (beta-lactamase class C family)
MSVQLINQYYNKSEKLIQFGSSKNELSIRNAFKDHLNHYAEKKNLLTIMNMKTLIQTLFFFLLVAQICLAQLQSNRSESHSEYPSINLFNSSVDIDSFITATMDTFHIPGLSACIVRDGEIIWKGAYGYADIANNRQVTNSTLFKLASVSKPFTATALMQLWENGFFDLDEDINNHLPFSVRNPYHPDDPITFRMLLTHTSSIIDNWSILTPLITWGADSPIPLDSFLTNYLVPGGVYYSNENYSSSAPLTSWHYTNVGATLIGYLVETISNIPFAQYCQDSVFIPLGMNEASWFLSNLDTNHIALPYYFSEGSYHSYGHYGMVWYPAGQIRTSAVQVARLLIAFMQKGQIDGIRILDSATVDLMTTVQFPNLNDQLALFWFIVPRTVPDFGTYNFCGHGGSSYGTRTVMDYTLDTYKHVGVVVLTNGTSDAGRDIIREALYSFSTTIPADIAGDLTTPEKYYLSNNYPNPFNPSTKIKFTIPAVETRHASSLQMVTLKVYDVLGNEIATLVNEEKPVGTYEITWYAASLPSGVYFYKLTGGKYSETKKMLLLR